MGLGSSHPIPFVCPDLASSDSSSSPCIPPANLYPHIISRLFHLSLSLLTPTSTWSADHAAALELQTLVSEADALYAPLGIAGCKATLQKRRGYGGVPRLPLAGWTAKDGKVEEVEKMEIVKRINEVEERLAREAEAGKPAKTNGVNGHAH